MIWWMTDLHWKTGRQAASSRTKTKRTKTRFKRNWKERNWNGKYCYVKKNQETDGYGTDVSLSLWRDQKTKIKEIGLTMTETGKNWKQTLRPRRVVCEFLFYNMLNNKCTTERCYSSFINWTAGWAQQRRRTTVSAMDNDDGLASL